MRGTGYGAIRKETKVLLELAEIEQENFSDSEEIEGSIEFYNAEATSYSSDNSGKKYRYEPELCTGSLDQYSRYRV